MYASTTAKYVSQATPTSVTEANSTTNPGKTISATIEDMPTIGTVKNDIEDLEIISKKTQNNCNASNVHYLQFSLVNASYISKYTVIAIGTSVAVIGFISAILAVMIRKKKSSESSDAKDKSNLGSH